MDIIKSVLNQPDQKLWIFPDSHVNSLYRPYAYTDFADSVKYRELVFSAAISWIIIIHIDRTADVQIMSDAGTERWWAIDQ